MKEIFIVVYQPKDIPAECEDCSNQVIHEFSNVEDAFLKMVELRNQGQFPRIFTEIKVGVTLVKPKP